ESVFDAGRAGLDRARPAGEPGRSRAETARPLPLDVRRARRLPRRVARSRPRDFVRGVRVPPDGQGLGGPVRAVRQQQGAPVTQSRPPRERVLSGMRPTGMLHLGNYLGALDNWVKLQEEFDCFFFVASWHMLTTDAADSGKAGPYT